MNRTRTFTVLKGIALPWIFALVLVGNFIEPLFANEVSFDVKLLDLKLDILAVEGVLDEFFDVDEPSQSQPVAQSTGNFSANIKARIQLANATSDLSLRNTSFGVLKPRHFLGRLFNLSMMSTTS